MTYLRDQNFVRLFFLLILSAHSRVDAHLSCDDKGRCAVIKIGAHHSLVKLGVTVGLK